MNWGPNDDHANDNTCTFYMYSKDTMAMAIMIDTLGVPTMPKLLIYSQSNNAKIDCGNFVNANSISWGPQQA